MSAVLVGVEKGGYWMVGSRPPSTGRLAVYRPGAAPAPASAPRRTHTSQLGGSRRLDRAVYRRRRLLVAGILMLVIAAALVLTQLIQAGIGGGPLTTTGAAAGPGMIQAGATEYVVRSGDTLWSIAESIEPGRDPRPLVDQLAREVGGASLYPGQVIPVPASR